MDSESGQRPASDPRVDDPESTFHLIDLARAGDQNAVERLFARHLKPLKRWASGRLPKWARDLADTEDLVQDAPWEKYLAAQGNVEFAERLTGVFAAEGWRAYWRERGRMASRRPTGVGGAAVYARLGRIDEAIRTLEQTYESRSLGGFASSPEFDPLRSDPRFQALRIRVGLSDEIKAQLAAARATARTFSRR